MGNAQPSKLPAAYLDELERETFFDRNEIDRLYIRFETLGGSLDKSISSDVLVTIPELRANPFQNRLCQVFGSKDEVVQGKHVMSFNQFMVMMNTMSHRAPIELKAYWAFKIYDFDHDNFINQDDLLSILKCTIGEEVMSGEQMNEVASQVMDEADLDGNKKLSRTEFIRIIHRLPDFATKFQFSIHLD